MVATAAKTGVTKYTTAGDREVVFTRVVDAPRRIVFEAWTTPRHLQKWLLGPEGWTMPICELDARPGGKWRYVWRKGDGSEMTLHGTVREFVPPERMVTTENWGGDWPETLNTVVFAEAQGQTTITVTVTYPSKEARDAALQTGMKEGMDQGFARLDELLKTLA
jgi:uncharacterized protein YndB with AHSA1/START domain